MIWGLLRGYAMGVVEVGEAVYNIALNSILITRR